MSKKLPFVIPDDAKIMPSIFDKEGGNFRLNMPQGTDAVILASNTGTGLKPYRYLLPGQVYVKDISEKFASDWSIDGIYAIPVRNFERWLIAAKNKESLSFWNKGEGKHERYLKYSDDMKANVKLLASSNLDDAEQFQAVDEMMVKLDRLIEDKVREAVSERDNKWRKKLETVGNGL